MIGFKSNPIFVLCLLLITVIAFLWSKAGYTRSTSEKDIIQEQMTEPAMLSSSYNSEIKVTTATTKTLYLPTVQVWVDPDPPWLSYLNLYRDQANLHHLVENGDWMEGARLHSQYMVKNDIITHYEDSDNIWFTDEGYTAGRNGNIFVSSWSGTSDETAIDFWMTGPFHAISMLDPQLQSTALGSYREEDGGWKMGATLDVSRGREVIPPGTTFPLPYPRDGGQIWLYSYKGNEWPDPLTSCSDYTPPTGPPIMLQLGDGSLTPNVTDFQLSMGGSPLPACLFDETSYINADGGVQSTGRLILGSRDAVVIMPRDPLELGQFYTASVTADGVTVEWSFSTVTSPNFAPHEGLFRFEVR